MVKDSSGDPVDNANPAPLGEPVHDTATLSGQVGANSFNGTATVTYSFYTNNDCTAPASGSPEQVTVAANGTVPDSSPQTLGAGSYSYKASYSGNANYDSATGDCEPFKVAKASPTITTVVKDSSGDPVDNANPAPLGEPVHDTATLSGQVGANSFNGTATVTYSFYTNNDCTAPASGTPEQVTVAANGTVPDSSPQTLGAGSYSYKASYSGNANYDSATGDCEPFKVAKATPTITTVVKDSSGDPVDNANPAPLGEPVHDTATLSGQVGANSFNGTATVTYAFYTNNDCTPPASGTPEQVTVAANGTVPDSSPQTLGAGSYSYKASYKGNANYDSATGDCEPFKVAKASPTITTVVKDSSGDPVDNANPAPLGEPVHDTATLSGQVGANSFNGSATVTYSFYTNNDCTAPASGSPEQVTVAANGSVPDSSPQTLGAGSYSYKASYSGNANYDSATGDCEPFKVAKASPTITTVVKDSSGDPVDNANPAPLGEPVHDTATLSGQVGANSFNGSATVTYSFYTNNDCTAPASGSPEQVTVAANGSVPDSSPQTLGAGSYSYKASYWATPTTTRRPATASRSRSPRLPRRSPPWSRTQAATRSTTRTRRRSASRSTTRRRSRARSGPTASTAAPPSPTASTPTTTARRRPAAAPSR